MLKQVIGYAGTKVPGKINLGHDHRCHQRKIQFVSPFGHPETCAIIKLAGGFPECDPLPNELL